MLDVLQVAAAYGQHRTLHAVSLHVDRGEVVVMLGANGAGMSALLKSVAGLVKTLPGTEIVPSGVALYTLPPYERVEAEPALAHEGRGIFGELIGAREHGAGRLSETGTRVQCAQSRACPRAVPAARGAPRSGSAHDGRRRAADGGDRPR